MAGTVTSNLTLVNAADAITGWLSGTGSTASTAVAETALAKQNSACLKVQSPTAAASLSQVVAVTAVNLTGATLYCWMSFNSLYLMSKLSGGGIRIRVADSTSPGVNWGEWFVSGIDVYSNVQGTTAATKQAGWTCFAIDCDRPYDAVSVTAPTKTAIAFIGIGCSATGADPSGNALDMFYWDVVRHDNRLGLGGGLTIIGGTAALPTSFQDLYDADRANTNAYGIVKKAVGAFALQGPITVGTTAQVAVTTFTDSSQIVLWDDAQVKNTGIYGITLNGAASFLTTVTLGQFVSSVASKGVSILSPGNSLYTLLGASGGKNAAGYGSLSTTTGSTITRTVGDWTKDGYVAGATVTTLGFTTAANNGTFHITAATTTALTVSETTLVTEAGATTRTVDGVNTMRWDLVVNANSALKAYACRFDLMGRGTLTSTSELRSCTFSNFGDITPAGATIDSCTFQDVYTFVPISGTWALIINATTDVTGKITNSKFVNCNRAVKITAAGTYTFNNLTFSGNTFDIENSIVATQYAFLAGANAVTTSLRSASFVGVSQSFTGTGGTLSSASFALKKTGAPTGNAVVKLYAHSGAFGISSIPTGAALATSDNINVANLTTAYVTTNIQFSTAAQQYALVNATNYVITVEYSGGSVGNTLDVGSNVGGHAGNYADLTGTTWTAIAANDATFSVYVNANVIINATSGANPGTFTNTSNGSTTIINSVTITITVLDSSGAGILNARVAVYKTSAIAAGSELLLTNTNASGVATTTFNYLVDTAVTIRVRFDSAGSTRYFPYESTGTIKSTGLSIIANMVTDTIAA